MYGKRLLSHDLDVAAQFLRHQRPGGPWVLVAIVPDGLTTTRTFTRIEDACTFIAAHNDEKNIYYQVNPVRSAANKKPQKTDITQGEFVQADLDPRDDESAADAKTRYLGALKTLRQPTTVVDSGNGIQALWRLKSPLGPERFAAIEATSKAITIGLGSKAGTQNIDRILRVPGTVNHPNRKKRENGRTACLAQIIELNDVSYELADFPAAEPDKVEDSGYYGRQPGDDEDPLTAAIRDGGARYGGDRSRAEFFVINEMLRRGYYAPAITAVLLERNNGVSAKVYEQNNPRHYVEEQIAHVEAKLALSVDKHGIPYLTQDNIRIALFKLGVRVRYDRFADRILIAGLEEFGPVLDDAAMNRLRLMIDLRYWLLVPKEMFYDVVTDNARRNGFHPVCDYLDGLKWDGVKRLDKWLTAYGGAEDTPYTNAVGALLLTAAVRRVRQPGCKFDEIVVLENPDQGTNKSSTLALLAVNPDWFTDYLPLHVNGKEVIELTRGRWIIEVAELAGMRKTEVEHVKGLLSRQVDRARMAYGRIPVDVPRQWVPVGTTNHAEYLKDTTGNRRFWPVRVKQFDLERLAQDRDQLWAEAAAREASGASVRLPKELWAAAAEEQAKRTTADPFYELLQNMIGHIEAGKIAAEEVWTILDMRGGQREQSHNERMGRAMRALGWTRNSAGTVRIRGKLVAGFVRGDPEKPRPTVMVMRNPDGLLIVAPFDDDDGP
ncbi:MAG TPA: VapE domain-containing protein [Gemmataceae bacterium]|nr:VapE domain-containing protein [Gemmataceae bacterium]